MRSAAIPGPAPSDAADTLPPAGPDGGAPSRIVVADVGPVVAAGRWPAKRVVGEPVDVTATVLADGHDRVHVEIAHQGPDGGAPAHHTTWWTDPGLDRCTGRFVPEVVGLHAFRVLAWMDEIGTWVDATRRKVHAHLEVTAELIEGAGLLRRAAEQAPRALAERIGEPPGDADATGLDAQELVAALGDLARRLEAGDVELLERADDGRPDSLVALGQRCLVPSEATRSACLEVLVERERAQFCAWYELFPRSWGPEPGVHGTLDDVRAQLDEIAAMGFDVVYLPPIHPIGTTNRKGPDNAETAEPGDPGSPWGIGAAAGGHTAVHPDLGDTDAVRRLADACVEQGMELALDVALQCSPDHPWVAEHPEWFRHRPDGSIQYAENPPKKYQDIYPLDFSCDDWRGLWTACRDIFLHWAEVGVRTFRVDNPHTKPFAFWEWCIDEVRDRYPETIFLSEAFTRPEPMHRLAALGFTQSYGYFPWRVTKEELTGYFREVSSPPSIDEMRPSSWPNTPDILPWHLQGASRRQFAIRLVLAATLSASYGIYGPAFELCDHVAAGNGKEEYGASEKYQLRWWDRSDPDSLRGLITAVNRARRDQLALHAQRTLRFHEASDDHLLAFSKTAHPGPDVDPARPADDTVLVVVNLDPDGVRSGVLGLDLGALGVDGTRPYEVTDLLGGETYTWHGANPYVELHPERVPAHVLRVTQHRD